MMLIVFVFSINDIKYRFIHNRHIIVLASFQTSFLIVLHLLNINSALIIFALGLVFFSFGFFGGGDIKYATILSLSLPMELLPHALLLTMLTGGVLACFYLLLRLVRRAKAKVYGGMEDSQYNPGIPYGVAISVGFYVMILSHWVKYL